MTVMTPEALHALLSEALVGQGFSQENATALADQTVLAEALGQDSVGVSHVFDYIDGLAAGRINGAAVPVISRPAPSILVADGDGGLPQAGFDLAFDDLADTARSQGLALFVYRGGTLCGALGTFPLRLAEAGLVSFAVTNGSPLLAGSGATKATFCTNPMAFAAPQADGPPLLIDQSSSATAYVNIRAAAERGDAIPGHWALDREGRPTTDPKAALDGALLAFGGARGGNIALMVDILAGGLAGANWSLDAPSFFDGAACPATGLFVLAIDPAPTEGRFAKRMTAQLRRLADDFGVYIPGLSKGRRRARVAAEGLDIAPELLDRLRRMA